MNALNKNKRKFLLLTSYTLPDTAGSGIHAFRFARFINRVGDQATILTFNRNCRLPAREMIENVPVYRIPYFNKGLIMKIISLPIVIYYYIRLSLKNDVIFIYGGKTYAYELAILIAKVINKKIVFRSLLFKIDDFETLIASRNRLTGFLYRKLFQHIDLYYSINSLFTIKYFAEFKCNNKIVEIPQGVDTYYFHPVQKEEKSLIRSFLNLPEDIFIILSVGFIIQRKGIIEIIDNLSRIDFPYLYIIIGEFDFNPTHFLKKYNKEARQIIEYGQLKLKDNVKFIGQVNDVDKYFKCCDILIHNANDEIPNVVYEAMACRMAVIAKRIKGISNTIFQHRFNCILSDEQISIYDAVIELSSDMRLCKAIGKNSENTVRQHVSFETIYKSLIHRLALS